ncbi:unnamed protein product [Diamesa serratosioi]
MKWIILSLVLLLNNGVLTKKHHSHIYYRQSIKKQQNQHTNISKLLDKLLENYDNSLRPNLLGPPVVVEIDLMVRSMSQISEVEMAYSMDCYFRQSWIDKRLAFEELNFSQNISTLALSISMLKKIWKPDTFFFNGKQSYLHTITTPNKFVRLYKNGRVLYSSRLTIKAACPMNLANFPMDVQRCPLKLGSFGYTTTDVLYQWNSRAVAISDDLKMSQFDLIEVRSSNMTDKIEVNPQKDSPKKDVIKFPRIPSTQEYSMLLVSFHLQRHMGNFLIQVYGPCILLVILSWVSFWLNREATADRISLGITTVLTMTFLGLEARTDLPKVSYPTALDFFVFLSFAFIFATILQFAVVHYFTKYGSGECYFNFLEDSSSESGESEDEDKEHNSIGQQPPQRNNFNGLTRLDSCDMFASGASTISHNSSRCRRHSNQVQPTIIKRQKGRNFNSVSKIDKLSRVIFPLLFFVINLFYWYIYLSRSKRNSKQS